MFFCDHKRRYDSEYITACRDHQQSFCQRSLYNFTNRAALDHDSLHEAHASSCCSAFMFCNNFIQLLFQIRSHFLYMFNDLIILINVKYFADCSTHKWVSTISCTMITWLQRSFGSFLIQYKRTYRHTTSKSLGTCHNIRLYTVCLPCKIMSGSSHTALDLIENQHNIFLITDLAQTFQKFFLCRINTALTLNNLSDDRAGLICNLSLYAFQIIKICKLHTAHQWLKGLSVMSSSCYGKCSDTSSMEGMVHGNDLMICMSVTYICIFLSCF